MSKSSVTLRDTTVTPVLLEASQVAKRFNGVSALRDGRLSLAAGRVHALCGGNGTGKSTFLNILMGLLRRDEGTIRLNGRDVDFASPAEALASRMAIITQELSPVPGMTVAENLYLGREPTRAGVVVDFRALKRRAQALLDRLGFAIDAGAPMHRLSLAQTQLVEIAKAFSHDCQVMI
ncbi:ATP-binding cassette domain-containing protein, partial [Burkholderia pseudomallei]